MQGSQAHAPVVDRLGYREDGTGLRRSAPQVSVVDVDSGTSRQLTDHSADAGQPRWSPDGSRIVHVAKAGDDADLTMTSTVFVVDTDPHHRNPTLAQEIRRPQSHVG